MLSLDVTKFIRFIFIFQILAWRHSKAVYKETKSSEKERGIVDMQEDISISKML